MNSRRSEERGRRVVVELEGARVVSLQQRGRVVQVNLIDARGVAVVLSTTVPVVGLDVARDRDAVTGRSVAQALVVDDGTLRVVLDDGTVFTVAAQAEREAWDVQRADGACAVMMAGGELTGRGRKGILPRLGWPFVDPMRYVFYPVEAGVRRMLQG